MLPWTITFFVLALIAGVTGFTGSAPAIEGIAKILFVVFVVLFITSFFLRATDKTDHALDRNL